MKKLAKRIRLNDKGFSLIELVIVIAIMAALIAILAPQYLKYVEKSRVSADQTTMDGIVTAVKVAASDADATAEDGTLELTCTDDVWTIGAAASTLSADFIGRVVASVGSDTFTMKSNAANACEAAGITITVAEDTYAVSCDPDYTTWTAS